MISRFNTTLVQLKGLLLRHFYTSLDSFNTTLVQLKVFMYAAKVAVFPCVSIPHWSN